MNATGRQGEPLPSPEVVPSLVVVALSDVVEVVEVDGSDEVVVELVGSLLADVVLVGSLVVDVELDVAGSLDVLEPDDVAVSEDEDEVLDDAEDDVSDEDVVVDEGPLDVVEVLLGPVLGVPEADVVVAGAVEGGGLGGCCGGGGELPVVGGPCVVAEADTRMVTEACEDSEPSLTETVTANDPVRV